MADPLDHLHAEPAIVARLKDRVPTITGQSLGGVYNAADLEGAQEGAQKTPALHVMLGGLTPTDEQAQGLRQQIDQRWDVVVVTRNANPRDPSGSRTAAGPFMGATMQALQGWRPSEHLGAMRLVRSPYGPTYRAGFAYFPLAFITRARSEGEG